MKSLHDATQRTDRFYTDEMLRNAINIDRAPARADHQHRQNDPTDWPRHHTAAFTDEFTTRDWPQREHIWPGPARARPQHLALNIAARDIIPEGAELPPHFRDAMFNLERRFNEIYPGTPWRTDIRLQDGRNPHFVTYIISVRPYR